MESITHFLSFELAKLYYIHRPVLVCMHIKTCGNKLLEICNHTLLIDWDSMDSYHL